MCLLSEREGQRLLVCLLSEREGQRLSVYLLLNHLLVADCLFIGRGLPAGVSAQCLACQSQQTVRFVYVTEAICNCQFPRLLLIGWRSYLSALWNLLL